MDPSTPETESELSALIRRHGQWCLILALIGAIVGAVAWFVLPKQFETSALLGLEGSDQARLTTEQWVASLYSRTSSFESFAEGPLEAAEIRRNFRSRATDESLFLRLSLRLSDPEKARHILESIAQSLEARNFTHDDGARVVSALPVETAERAVSPQLPLLIASGAALGGFGGLLLSLLRGGKRNLN